MNGISEERIKNFIADISDNDEFFLEDLSDEYGNGYLSIAIMNGDFDPEFLLEYLMGNDPDYFFKSPIWITDFDQKLAEILEIHDRITEAEGLLAKAVSVLSVYSRINTDTFEMAMDEFWENTSRNPKAMLIELLEECIL